MKDLPAGRSLELDLFKLATAFYENLQTDDSCEFGSIGLDCKRPFGNSNAEHDILEIIGWKPEGDDGDRGPCYASFQEEYARNLYFDELVPFLREQWHKGKE